MLGLYPESQGIIGNKAYDPNFDEKVNFLDRNDANRFNPKWWNNTEPIWLSAKNQVFTFKVFKFESEFKIIIFLGLENS